MNYIKKVLKPYSHFLILLYYFVILSVYMYLNRTTVPQHFMYILLDDYIPFVPIMVIPYLLWYPYIAFSLVYLGFVNKKLFYQLCLFMFIGMTLSYIIYILYPNGQNLRPVISGSDWLSSMINQIYRADKPTNSAPSMHVIDSVAVFIALKKCEKLRENNLVQFLSGTLTILIIMSTVMIKQHSMLDVFYGLLMSLFLYVIIYKFEFLYKRYWDGKNFSIRKVFDQ